MEIHFLMKKMNEMEPSSYFDRTETNIFEATVL